MAIPRTVHVCWFGRGIPGAKIKQCLRSIQRLSDAGYDVRFWTEDNYDLTKSPRLVEAVAARRWSLVSNYARLDLLNEYGGIYLDADVQVHRPFDDLLRSDFFIGYIWDCTLGTAVIGAAPGHPIVRQLLDMYDRNGSTLRSPNNDTFTDFFIDHVAGFKLDGQADVIGTTRVLDKFSFEHPRAFARGYTVHHLAQSWVLGSRFKQFLRNIAVRSLPLWAYRRYICSKSLRISPYYAEYQRRALAAEGATPADPARHGNPSDREAADA